VSEKRVVIAPSRGELASLVADKFLVRASKAIRRTGSFCVVLTGGTVGIETLAAIAQHPLSKDLDWSKVSLWWGDERFVPRGHPDRNDQQAAEVFLDFLPLDPAKIHRFPTSDDHSLEEGASEYAAELRAAARDGEEWPTFDLAFVGMGPDGHVLSVFPGTDHATSNEIAVATVRNSPKPPPERLTMSLALLNRAERVWMVVSGIDKAAALGLALANASTHEVPAAGVSGTRSTKIFIDKDLAQLLPADLVVSDQFWSAEDERADYVPKALR
jgi:6-phosphogluconolactonase